MKKIIEKLYAEELGLSTVKPEVATAGRGMMTRLKENIWSCRSRTFKATVIVLFFLLVTGGFHYFNLFITESYYVRLEVAQMDAEIRRKDFLIPGLAQVVEDYMKYEGRVFIHAVDVRSALEPFMEKVANGTSQTMDMQTLARYKEAIAKFQAVAENYPMLKSSEAYQKFMLELANTETRLTIARNRYNFVVNRYNTKLALIPGVFFGYPLGFKQAKIFVADKPH